MVSDVDAPQSQSTPIKINQDANIKVTELEPGHTVDLSISSGRQAYLLCMEGSLNVTDKQDASKTYSLERHDAAEIFGSSYTFLAGSSGAHLLMVEMAFTGRGRGDI